MKRSQKILRRLAPEVPYTGFERIIRYVTTYVEEDREWSHAGVISRFKNAPLIHAVWGLASITYDLEEIQGFLEDKYIVKIDHPYLMPMDCTAIYIHQEQGIFAFRGGLSDDSNAIKYKLADWPKESLEMRTRERQEYFKRRGIKSR